MYKRLQTGLVLPMVLIFLVIMMFLGTAAIRSVTLEEKMSGNLRGRNLAFQAAEQALRYCENSILKGTTTADHLTIHAEGPIVGGADNGKNYWEASSYWSDPAHALTVPARAGESTRGAPSLAARPQCMAEIIAGDVLSEITTGSIQSGSGDVRRQFRITARGSGLDSSTVVQLQSYLIF